MMDFAVENSIENLKASKWDAATIKIEKYCDEKSFTRWKIISKISYPDKTSLEKLEQKIIIC